MRETKAPENQLIEKLDSIIHSLKTASGNKASLSFVGYKKNLLSLVESKLVSQDAALVEAAFSVTQRFVALLIEKSTQEQVVTPEQFDLIIKSLCAEQSKESKLTDLVMAIFVVLLRNYRESIVEVCNEYQLTLPQDNTYKIADFSDPCFDDIDAKVTMFRLQEIQYLLNLVLNKSVEELSRLHPVKDLPYIRHIYVSDKIVEQIMNAQEKLACRIVTHIEDAKNALREAVSNYSEVTDINAIIENERELLTNLERDISTLALIRAQLKVAGSTPFEQLEATLSNIIVFQRFQDAVLLLQQKFTTYQEMEKLRMRVVMEMRGTDLSPSDLSRLNINGCSRETSRLGFIEQLINSLIDRISHEQLLACESKSDFGLKKFVEKLGDLLNPLQSTMNAIENTLTMRGCLEKFRAEISTFEEAKQQTCRPSSSQTTATSSSVSFFNSRQCRNTEDKSPVQECELQ